MSAPLAKPPDKADKIIVKQIVDPCTFWVSEAPEDHRTPGRMCVAEIEKCLVETRSQKAVCPQIDQLVAVRESATRRWHRGKIKNIIVTATSKVYEVLLIDCGKMIQERSSSLYELPLLLRGEKPHAFQLVLYGIVPLHMDLMMNYKIAEEWSPAVVCVTKEMIQLDSYGFIVPKFCNEKEKIVYGDLYIGTRTKSVNWGDFLVQRRYSIVNETVFRERAEMASTLTTRKGNLGEENQNVPKVAGCGNKWSPDKRNKVRSSGSEDENVNYNRRRMPQSRHGKKAVKPADRECLSSDSLSTESSTKRRSKSPVRTFFPAGFNMGEADQVVKELYSDTSFSGDEIKTKVKKENKGTLEVKLTSRQRNAQHDLDSENDSSKDSSARREPVGHKFQQKHETNLDPDETSAYLKKFLNKRIAARSSESETSDSAVGRGKRASPSISSGPACSMGTKGKAIETSSTVSPSVESTAKGSTDPKIVKSALATNESNNSLTSLPPDSTLGLSAVAPQASSTPVLSRSIDSQGIKSVCDSVQSDILRKDLSEKSEISSELHEQSNTSPTGSPSDKKTCDAEIRSNKTNKETKHKGNLSSVTFEPDNYSNLLAQDTLDMPTLTEQMQSVPVLVHNIGKKIDPFQNIDDVMFLKEIHDALQQYVKRMMRIQKYSWRAILKERNLVMISPRKSGKTLAYIAPLSSLLLQKKKRDMIPKGGGPVILILCSGSSNVLAVKTMCKNLLRGCDIKVIGAYGGGADGADTECQLVNGCHILVTTPRCLYRLLLRGKHILNLNRLNYLVLDEADILTLRFLPEIEQICIHMSSELKKRSSDTAHLQVVAAAEKWCPGVENMAKNLHEPVICIGAYQEAIVYSHIKPQVHIVKEDSRLSVLIDIFQNRKFQQRTIVVCHLIKEVNDVAAALQELNMGVILVAHEEMMSFDLHNIFVKWGWEKLPTLVCTDTYLQEMSIQDAEALIHYSLPADSRTLFSFRFSCLFKKLPSCLPDIKKFQDSTEANNSHHPITIHILVGDDDCKQLPFLTRFLKRVGVPVDSEMQARSVKAEVEKELKKDTAPLCYNFKVSGDCWKKAVCEFRHVVSEKDKPQSIPRTGTVKLKIIHTHDACTYSARLLEHTDESGKTQPVRNLLMTLTRKLHSHFKEKDNRVPWPDPKAYDICAIETSCDVFERVQVLSAMKRDKNDIPKEVLIRLIDDGSLRNVSPLALLALPAELRDLPPQAVEVYLCRLNPCDLDWSWGNAAGTQVNKIIRDADKTGRYMIGKIKLSLGCTIWVDPLECRQHLPNLKTSTLIFSLRSKLLKMKLAVENPEHLINLYNACEAGGLELPEQTEEKPQTEEERPEIKVEVQWAFLPVDDFIAVSFIVGENPGSFFVRQTKFETCLNQLSKKLCEAVEESTTPERNFLIGDYCIGKFPEDGEWYRARVEATEENILSLFYVDHGDRASIPRCDARPIPDNLLTQLPFQAIECSLAAVKPNDGKWSEEATDWLYEITAEETGPFVKVLYAKVCQKIGSSTYGGSKYSVILIDKNENNTSVLNKVMVDQGLACIVEEEKNLLENIDTSEIETQTHVDDDDEDNVQIQNVSGAEIILDNDDDLLTSRNTQSDRSWQTINQPSEENDSELVNESDGNSVSETPNTSVIENQSTVFNWDELDYADFQHFVQFVLAKQNAERRALKAKGEEIPDKSHVNSDDESDSESPSVSGNGSSNELKSTSYKDTSSSELNLDTSLIPRLESRTRHPEIIWRQDDYNVWLNINLPGVEDYYLSWDIEDLEFWASLDGNEYFFHFNLFGSINPNKVTHSGGGLCIKVKLQKLVAGLEWPRLIEEQSKKCWLKKNFDEKDNEIENLSQKLLQDISLRKKSVTKRKKEPGPVRPVDTSDEDDSGSDIVLPDDEQYDKYDPLN